MIMRRIPVFLSTTQGGSLQDQIIEQMRSLIVDAKLPLGTKLPSTRALATQLRIARRTVTLAFDRLAVEGYIETKPASGTFVAQRLPTSWIHVSESDRAAATSAPNVPRTPSSAGLGLHVQPETALPYDLRLGRPDASLFPVALWRQFIRESVDSQMRSLGDYMHPQGHPLLRDTLCQHLFATRGIVCSPDQVVVVAGTQDGLNLVARMLAKAGDEVSVEDPCYLGAARAFLELGLTVQSVQLDDEGLCVDQLSDAAKLVYVTPSHQFPLGMTMSLGRRRAIVEWARSAGSYVVEDDYDGDLRYSSSPLPAITALGSDCTIYLGTFSKSIGPALRLGYVVVPPQLVAAAYDTKAVMSNGHPWLEQAAMARFLETDAFERHLVQMRGHYSLRRDRLSQELLQHFPGSRFSGMEGGMHLLWHMPPDLPSADILQEACAGVGVGLYGLRGSPTYVRESHSHYDHLALLGYSALKPDAIEQAVHRIAKVASRLSPAPDAPDKAKLQHLAQFQRL
jgi:GntR family transcriptional regulator/MocR family aminotransferase